MDENDYGPDSDIDFHNFEAASPPEFCDEVMNNPTARFESSSLVPETHLMKPLIKEGNRDSIYQKAFSYGGGMLGTPSPLGACQDFFGPKQYSKLSTDISIEKIFSIKSLPNPTLGDTKSLPNSTCEGLKGESASLTKKGDDSPSSKKFSLASYYQEEKTCDKKSKQERNRESAKKCRQRKKEYLYRLETELRTVKEELAICKCELEILKGNLLSNVEYHFKTLKEELLSQAKVIIEHGMVTTKLDEILNNLTVTH